MADGQTTKKSAGSGYKRFEKNIYREYRSAHSVRFKVEVYPLPAETRTFDRAEELAGQDWARAERVLLLRRKRDRTVAPGTTERKITGGATTSPSIQVPSGTPPEFIPVSAILDNYETSCLPLLSTANSRSSAKSRLKRLRASFGALTMGELTAERLTLWRKRRFAGLDGVGRSAWRLRPSSGEAVPTKDQRRRRAQAVRNGTSKTRAHPADGVAQDSADLLHGPASQSVRHEMRLFRTACNRFFQDEAWKAERAWLAFHPLMTAELPPASAPRERRLSEEEQQRLLLNCHSPTARAAIRFALANTLRRTEVVSLLWEDVDLKRCTVLLRKALPDASSKTRTRFVPLVPDALELLKEMGPRKAGRIFPISASSLSQAFRRAADRAGLPDVRLHDTRREAVSHLAEIGVEPQLLMSFTGHTRFDVLEKHYLRPSAALVAERVATLVAQRGAPAAGG